MTPTHAGSAQYEFGIVAPPARAQPELTLAYDSYRGGSDPEMPRGWALQGPLTIERDRRQRDTFWMRGPVHGRLVKATGMVTSLGMGEVHYDLQTTQGGGVLAVHHTASNTWTVQDDDLSTWLLSPNDAGATLASYPTQLAASEKGRWHWQSSATTDSCTM